MDSFDRIKIATTYKVNGKEQSLLPYDVQDGQIEPVYREFAGWKRDLSAVVREEELPFEFMNYIRFIEKETGVPISMISLGPDRAQTIIRQV